jgi:hypothetical protein
METFGLAQSAEFARLEASVKERLQGLVRHFRLLRSGDGLIMEGRAPSYYAKQLAQHAVMKVTALRIVANQIRVD